MAQIDKPNLHFNTKLYTGNASTNAITGVGFQPDLIWGKDRAGDRHWWADAVRGKNGTGYSLLSSNNTEADTGNYPSDGVTAIGSDGFTLGANSSNDYGGWSNEINQNSGSYVAWNWKANGAGSSNSDGSVTSTVSANTTAGFSICTFTQASSGSFTFGHGLGVAPDMVIGKSRGNTSNWQIFHTSLGTGKFIQLNSTGAQQTVSNFWGTIDTSIVTIGSNQLEASQPSVYYCFAEKKGYSKFGSYTGNGNADGTFVYTGFSPAFVLLKNAGEVEQWWIFDNKRNAYDGNFRYYTLNPNSSAAEGTNSADANHIDFLSNGFKLRTAANQLNGSGDTLIYMAFAQNPIVGSNNIPAVSR